MKIFLVLVVLLFSFGTYAHRIIDPTEKTRASILGDGGQISPEGIVHLKRDRDQTFVITPNQGFVIASIIIDGTETKMNSAEAIKRVIRGNGREHVIQVRFQKVQVKTEGEPASTGKVQSE